MHDTPQKFNIENHQRGEKNHKTKTRKNSLSISKICTSKFYSKQIRVLCKEESKMFLLKLKTQPIRQKDHNTWLMMDVVMTKHVGDVIRGTDGEGKAVEYEFLKILLYSLIEICSFFLPYSQILKDMQIHTTMIVFTFY